MRFVVYGAGAIGGVIGGRLFATRPRRRADRARRALRSACVRHGLRLVDPEHDVTLPVPRSSIRPTIDIDGSTTSSSSP